MSHLKKTPLDNFNSNDQGISHPTVSKTTTDYKGYPIHKEAADS